MVHESGWKFDKICVWRAATCAWAINSRASTIYCRAILATSSYRAAAGTE